jgi:hypothetical protein
MRNGLWKLFILPVLAFLLAACGTIQTPEDIETPDSESTEAATTVVEGEYYDTPYAVSEYIEVYGELPKNYLTKDEASDLGWVASEGNLWEVAPAHSIGGDYFGNYEELLPEDANRDYFEADIDYDGGHRNAKRLVFSNDGLYFYTDDHYESFEEIEVGADEQ